MLIFSLIFTPVLVRVLTEGQYGEYAFMLSIFETAIILVNAGIFDGVRKFIAEDRDVENWEYHVFGFYSRIAGIMAVVAVLLIIIASATGLIGRFLGEQFTTYFYLLALVIFFKQAFQVARSALMGFGLEHYSESIRLGRHVLYGLIGIPLAYIGWGVSGVLFGHLIGFILATVVSFSLVNRLISLRSILDRLPSEISRKELLSFNTLTVVFIFLTASLYHTDILLLQPLAGSEVTGYYKAALVIAEFVWFAPLAIQTALLHSVSGIWAEGDYERITSIASKVTRYTTLFSILLLLGLAALADVFVPLYFGEEFSEATLPLLILLPGVLGFSVARPIFSISQSKGELRVLIFTTGVAAALNLVLNLLLIPAYGMLGAAVATSIGYGTMVFLHIWSARKIGFDPLADIRLVRISLTVLITAPVIFGLASLIQLYSDIAALFLVPLIGFAVYSLASYSTGAVDSDEIVSLTRRLPISSNKLRDLF